jgi:preprotein translocase subunit SecE
MSSVAKESDGGGSLVGELFQLGLYKPKQGRLVRQLTFLSVAILAVLIGREFSYADFLSSGNFWLGAAVALAGIWFAYRVVNYPKFTDFLISVQAELNKVTWPSTDQLKRATVVVIFVIFAMALFLYVFDIIWTFLFQLLGIRYSG